MPSRQTQVLNWGPGRRGEAHFSTAPAPGPLPARFPEQRVPRAWYSANYALHKHCLLKLSGIGVSQFQLLL